MKAVSVVVTLCVFMTSCAINHRYYDEDLNGSRFYETKSGDRLKVMVDGTVWKGDEKLGVARKKGADWDVSAYDIQPAYNRCYNLIHWDQTVACEQYLLVPLAAIGPLVVGLAYLVLAIGFLALDGVTITGKG